MPPLAVPRRVLEEWLYEDIGRGDLTSRLLGLRGVRGEALVYTREECIVACSEEAAEVYRIAGAEVEVVAETGRRVGAGEAIIRAVGDGEALHVAWRVAQVILALCSGVATVTARLVEEARRVNKHVMIVTTRKAPPGLRSLYQKAVIAGGGLPHRAGLDDSILVFDNHVALTSGGLRDAIARLASRAGSLRLVGVEVSSLEEALEAVEAGAEYIQFEKIPVEKLRKYVRVLREKAPRVRIGAAGGITLENVREYASTGVDVIVTSYPYYARPVDMGTRMRRL